MQSESAHNSPGDAPQAPLDLPAAAPWFKRHRRGMTAGVGVLLFSLAIVIPMLAPVNMRAEILPMPIALGLAGALCLFSAQLPEPSAGARSVAAKPAPLRAPRAMTHGAPVKVPLARKLLGAGFGVLFMLAGLIAPFVLEGGAGPDERFVMMIGFAPVALVGVFLIWMFTRGGAPAAAVPARQSAWQPAPRVKRDSRQVTASNEYHTIVRIAIAMLVVLLLTILAVVVYATATPLLK